MLQTEVSSSTPQATSTARPNLEDPTLPAWVRPRCSCVETTNEYSCSCESSSTAFEEPSSRDLILMMAFRHAVFLCGRREGTPTNAISILNYFLLSSRISAGRAGVPSPFT